MEVLSMDQYDSWMPNIDCSDNSPDHHRREAIRSPPLDPSQPEKAQIDIQGADHLYGEIRIDSEMTDEKGDKAQLKEGAEVEVIVEAGSSATLKKAK
jgi:hypothetical protein